MAEYDTVAIVGVGLIGGSIGQALRERKLARQVVGIGRRESSLESARRVGAIDRGTTDLADGVAQAELVIVCTPVDMIAELAVRAAATCPADAMITDAGSTKAAIVATVDAALAGRQDGPRFIGGHPLAGDHRAGPQHARGDLLDGRIVVVTRREDTPSSLVERAERLWQSLGAKVVFMSPDQHDRALAATSHLPHLVAAALTAATPREWLRLAATGWADTTRIAASNPELWSQVLRQNRDSVLDALRQFEQCLEGMKEALRHGTAADLTTHLQEAKGIRDALGD